MLRLELWFMYVYVNERSLLSLMRCAELGAYSILVPLIEHPNAQVRTHINGTLYTLLGVKAIRAEALKMGAEARNEPVEESNQVVNGY